MYILTFTGHARCRGRAGGVTVVWGTLGAKNGVYLYLKVNLMGNVEVLHKCSTAVPDYFVYRGTRNARNPALYLYSSILKRTPSQQWVSERPLAFCPTTS